MEALMTTTSFGGELISFKLDGIEKIHQGENSRDDNGKIYLFSLDSETASTFLKLAFTLATNSLTLKGFVI